MVSFSRLKWKENMRFPETSFERFWTSVCDGFFQEYANPKARICEETEGRGGDDAAVSLELEGFGCLRS